MTDEAVVLSEFQIMDAADEQQIIEADSAILQTLVYEVKGKKALSAGGVKWLVLKMSQKGQSLQTEIVNTDLYKHDLEDKTTWVWYSTVASLNLKTNLKTFGMSEASFLGFDGSYDTFGRTKASSKAERNANRKQIPEAEIQILLNHVDSKNVKKLDGYETDPGNNSNNSGTGPIEQPTEEQIKQLTDLGWTGKIPTTKHQVTGLSTSIKKRTLAVTEKDSLWAKYMDKPALDTNVPNAPPTDKQMKQLEELDYSGPKPFSVAGANALITKLKSVTESNSMCWCATPNPSNDTVPTGPNTGSYVCTRCNCLIKELMPEATQK